MTDPICVLDASPRADVRDRARRLSSRKALKQAWTQYLRHAVWVARSEETLVDLIQTMAVSPPGVRRARLVSYVRPEPHAAQILESAFARTLLGAGAMVRFEDLTAILGALHPEDHCIAAEWDQKSGTLALWRGDLSVLVMPVSSFPTRGGIAPDLSRLSVEDCGQTVRMGDYESSVDAILFERDPEYRRRARRRMLKEHKSLGASIRRLRLLRGLARTDFHGLDEKTLARIERDEVARPQRATLESIAKRLGVSVPELAQF